MYAKSLLALQDSPSDLASVYCAHGYTVDALALLGVFESTEFSCLYERRMFCCYSSLLATKRIRQRNGGPPYPAGSPPPPPTFSSQRRRYKYNDEDRAELSLVWVNCEGSEELV